MTVKGGHNCQHNEGCVATANGRHADLDGSRVGGRDTWQHTRYVKPESPLDTAADTCRGGGQDCWRDTEEVKAKALENRQADSIRRLKAKTSSDALGNK